MATEETGKDAYSGRSRFELRLIVQRSDTDGNRSKYKWFLRTYNLDGTNQTWDSTPGSWAINVEGTAASGSKSLDFRGGQSYIQIASGETGFKTHNSAGELTVNYSANHSNVGIFGSASLSGDFASTPLITVPGKAPAMKVVSTTPTAIEYSTSAPSNGGASFTRSQHQATPSGTGWDTPDHSFLYTEPDNNSRYAFNGLASAKKYALRVRYENTVGWGEWSDTTYGTTLPPNGPSLVVAPAPDGKSATVTVGPPSGGTGVKSYQVEHKAEGSSVWVVQTITGTSVTVHDLSPDKLYSWRALATFATYVSPYTTISVRQPKPSLDPGDYFDGDTTDAADVTYSWSGTVGLSKSVANGRGVTAWKATTPTGPTNVVLTQVTGGHSHAYSARLLVTKDLATAPPSWQVGGDPAVAGARSVVAGDASYVGSIYVKVHTANRLAAVITWLDPAGTVLSSSPGDGVLVTPAGGWVRLSVTATAPGDATLAVVGATDVAGDGWVRTISSDTVQFDDAMLTLGEQFPYFDGATPDDEFYDYEWMGAAHSSPSTRSPLSSDEQRDPLADPDCAVVVAPPRPPTVPDECITETGVWRRYWAQIGGGEVSDWLEVIPTTYLQTGGEAARQVRIRIYENPENRSAEEFAADTWISEQIVSYIPPNTLMTLDGVSQRAWGSVEGGPPQPADKLLYGTDGGPATWPVLSCGSAYLVSFDAPFDTDPGNIAVRLALSERTN